MDKEDLPPGPPNASWLPFLSLLDYRRDTIVENVNENGCSERGFCSMVEVLLANFSWVFIFLWEVDGVSKRGEIFHQ